MYLGWLLCAQGGELEDDEIEPHVPPGLGGLSASLESLAELLRVDPDLIDAAAAASPPLRETEPKPGEIREWLARLPVATKDDFLTRLMADNDAALANELAQRMRRERQVDQGAGELRAKPRTVAELLRAGEQAAAERKRVAAEKAAKEKAQRERAAARARAKHLDELAGTEPMLWQRVDSLIATRKPKSYDEAIQLLVDLRDLAAQKDEPDFRRLFEALRSAHASKPALIERFRRSGL